MPLYGQAIRFVVIIVNATLILNAGNYPANHGLDHRASQSKNIMNYFPLIDRGQTVTVTLEASHKAKQDCASFSQNFSLKTN
jgi:hypothetical protein